MVCLERDHTSRHLCRGSCAVALFHFQLISVYRGNSMAPAWGISTVWLSPAPTKSFCSLKLVT